MHATICVAFLWAWVLVCVDMVCEIGESELLTVCFAHTLTFAHLQSCPDDVYFDIMLRCWEADRVDRPTFSDLRKMLDVKIFG